MKGEVLQKEKRIEELKEKAIAFYESFEKGKFDELIDAIGECYKANLPYGNVLRTLETAHQMAIIYIKELWEK